MPRKLIPLAICYDFDGTLSPGYMQNYNFIPALGKKPKDFWGKVKKLAREQNGDEILIYMGHMLRSAQAAEVRVTRAEFMKFGATVELFRGVKGWFKRINTYGKARGILVSHYIISSGLREMIEGTPVAKNFTAIFASGFWYDHHDVACFPALGVNYTTKTQYLFRINKGSLDVWEKDKINSYILPSERPIPFRNIVFFGDGETDIPCFRLVKDLGGHSIAVYRPRAKRGGKSATQELISQGRVHFVVPANYENNGAADKVIKSIIEKVAADGHLVALGKSS